MSHQMKLFSRLTGYQFPANTMPWNHGICKKKEDVCDFQTVSNEMCVKVFGSCNQLTEVQKQFIIFKALFLSNLGKAFILIPAGEAHRQNFHAVTSGGVSDASHPVSLIHELSWGPRYQISSCEVSLSHVVRTWSAEDNNLLKDLFFPINF